MRRKNVNQEFTKREILLIKIFMTDQQVLELIDKISGDEFCEDLNCRNILGKEFENQPKLKEASEKLSKIYRLAHSHVKSNSCFEAHEAWRKEANQTTS